MKTMLRLAAVLLSGTTVLTAAQAFAQQQIDEPRLDPIFGEKRPSPTVDRPRVTSDDEFDQDKKWRPLRDFVGVFTFLAPSNTDLSIGVGPEYRPDYFGSDDFEWRADPEVYVKFRNFVFLDNDGADIALFGFSGFSFGPSIRLVGDRDEDDNAALTGLGDIDHTFEVGGFAATKFVDRFLFRAKIRKGVVGGHDGLSVDAAGTFLLFRFGRVSTSVSGNATWIGDSYADTYFSVTPAQSAASGLPVYDAGRGIRDVGGSLNAYINIMKRWSLNPYVSYRYILPEFANTPIIETYGDQNQYIAGFHIMREFNFKWRD
ncbi:MAG: MipA/OmpV family protein [Parvularculaceae bacterium]|nr:MipA/OmpV family protein [Parvularculaceae bacterium]